MGIIVCTHEFIGEERIRGEGKSVVENLPTPSFPVLASDFFFPPEFRTTYFPFFGFSLSGWCITCKRKISARGIR